MTHLYIDTHNYAGTDYYTWVNALGIGAYIVLFNQSNPTQIVYFVVNTVTNHTTWFDIAVTEYSSAGTLGTTAGDLVVTVAPQGPQGSQGITGQPGATGATGAVGVVEASETELTGTSVITVATYTPGTAGNFKVSAYFRVTAATTTVTLTFGWTDMTGVQTLTYINALAVPVGSYATVEFIVNSVASSAITVKFTAGTANQVYASATILEA
jgi:hypothetical protein